MVNIVEKTVNTHPVNAVVNTVIVVRQIITVERVVNLNLVNVRILRLPPKLKPPLKLKLPPRLRLLLLQLPFQFLLLVNVVRSMVNVHLVNVVVSMVGVVRLMLTVEKVVNPNLENVIKLLKEKQQK